MMISRTTLLGSTHQSELDALRYSTLVNEGTFTALPEAVRWSEADQTSKVFGIFSKEGTLISSMRSEVIKTKEALVPRLDFDSIHDYVSLPCGLLGKASTHSEHQGQGLNTYLRYLAYQDFFEQGIEYVVGTVMPHAVRIPLLKSLGYQFIENPEGWRRFGYQSYGKTWVCYLNLKKTFPSIIKILEPKIKELKRIYPYVYS
jgi:hypothetical protein